MRMSLGVRELAGAIILAAFCAAALHAQDDEGEARGGTVISAPKRENKYDRALAVIVGINYSKDNDGITPLNNAENDARQLYAVLTKYYGYRPEDVRLLLGTTEGIEHGEAATKSNLQTVLEDLAESKWKAKGQEDTAIGDSDSVLLFFSGHGMKDAIEGHLEIMTSDSKLEQGKPRGGVPGSTLIKAMTRCNARHRLIVLDCCHAGDVYDTVLKEARSSRPAGVFSARDSNTSFQERGFQIMVAAHSMETAQDGKGENSPFSEALLKSLKIFPREWREPYTVRQLFGRMDFLFFGRKQSPDLRWLDSSTGDFHFFPDPKADFESEIEAHLQLRNLLIAMVPGINGNWWFEETPWMMPALRQEIISQLNLERAGNVGELSVEDLYEAAQKYLDHMPAKVSKLQELRLAHIRQLLRSKDLSRAESLKTILVDLEQFEASQGKAASAEGSADNRIELLEAVDLHLKAVIAHRLANLSTKEEQEKVSRYYQEALARYRSDRMAEGDLSVEVLTKDNTVARPKEMRPLNTTRALHSLCSSDYAHFLSLLPVPDDRAALQHAVFAREELGSVSLPPVEIFLACKEAQAMFRLGMWGAANDRMDSMVSIARGLAEQHKKDNQGPHPLPAWAYKEYAWCLMDQWRVTEARELFKAAHDHLTPLTQAEDSSMMPTLLDGGSRKASHVNYDAVIAFLHNKHGLAITERYNGNSSEAAAEYASLIQAIRIWKQQHIRDTRNSYSLPEIQGRLVDRLVNSLERRGDCGLLGDPQNLVQAEDDYRMALREWVQLPARDIARRTSISDRRALALALPSAVQDIALSRSILDDADELSDSTLKLDALWKSVAGGERVKARVTGMLADLVLRTIDSHGETRETVFGQWRQLLDVQTREGLISRSIPRDELEALLFGSRLLIEFQLQQEELNRAKLYGDVELLTNLCRLINREQLSSELSKDGQLLPGGTAVGLRSFLRPYYDLAIEAHVRLKGKHVRASLEVVIESLSGPSLAAHVDAPRIYFYNTPRSSYLFMDVPGEVSNVYLVSNSSCIERAQRAAENGQALLSLPSTFVADWKRLSKESQTLIAKQFCEPSSPYIVWRDDVRSIGCKWVLDIETVKQVTSAGTDIPAIAGEANKWHLQSTQHFPIDLLDLGIVPCEKSGVTLESEVAEQPVPKTQ